MRRWPPWPPARAVQQEATDWLIKAVAVDPTAVTPTVNLISQYLKLKQTQKALDIALQLKVTHPDDPDLLDLMGKAQLANNDLDGAHGFLPQVDGGLAPFGPGADAAGGAMLMVTKKDRLPKKCSSRRCPSSPISRPPSWR